MCNIKESRLHLFGQQLFTQRVEGDKLPCEDPSVNEALGHQHDFTDQLEVGHHHGTWSAEKRKASIKRRSAVVIVILDTSMFYHLQYTQFTQLVGSFCRILRKHTWQQSKESSNTSHNPSQFLIFLLCILYLIYASVLQYLLSSFLYFCMFIVMHQYTRSNSLYVKIYLAINLILILILIILFSFLFCEVLRCPSLRFLPPPLYNEGE